MKNGRDAFDTARRCREGRQSPVLVVKESFARIDKVEPQIEAVLHLAREEALERARELERRGPPAGGSGLLFGVPLAVKDNICVKGQPASCGSRILAGYRPSYNATVIEHALAEGAVLIARTNMDEFAMGSSTENSAFKTSYNPWDRGLSPGGSSGGSAAIVAAGAVPIALGSDTGGSIRQPAALCGAVGFKPTYGTVSRYGLIAFASSFDQIGPLAQDVRDAALLFQAIAGHDGCDSTSIPGYRPDVLARLDDGIEGIRIGIPARFTGDGIEEEVAQGLQRSLDTFEELGAEIAEIEIPHARYAVPAYYLAATAEASANLARYDGMRFGRRAEGRDLISALKNTRSRGFGREVKMRIMLGTFALSSGYRDEYYGKALAVRRLVAEDFAKAFESVDLIAGPTSPVAAVEIGERIDDPLTMYLCDSLTTPASLAGIPAVSLPCGLTAKNRPLGIQIAGPALQDALVLRAARGFEKKRKGGPIRSPLAAGLDAGSTQIPPCSREEKTA